MKPTFTHGALHIIGLQFDCAIVKSESLLIIAQLRPAISYERGYVARAGLEFRGDVVPTQGAVWPAKVIVNHADKPADPVADSPKLQGLHFFFEGFIQFAFLKIDAGQSS